MTQLINILILISFLSIGQQIPTYKTKVSETDKIDLQADKDFGVGDDGIYDIVEPTVIASSELHEGKQIFKASNIKDYNLGTPWIESKLDYGIGEYVEFSFDLRDLVGKDTAFSINSFFIVNGYRKNGKVWKENSRVKKLKMSINNKPFAYILLEDTYKFQRVEFSDYWFKYGSLGIVKFEIMEVYQGDKFKETAISEIQFAGKHSENK